MGIEDAYSQCLEHVFAVTTAVLAEVFGKKFEARRVAALDDDAGPANRLNAEIVWRSEEELAWGLNLFHIRNESDLEGVEQLLLELRNQA